MDRKRVEKLFILFTRDTDVEKYSALIDIAILHTKQLLREDADENDERLNFYAASCANLDYLNMLASQIRISKTFAGNIAEIADCTAQVERADAMTQEYFILCASLFKDKKFYFINTGEKI